ncbi:MAG TPA: GntR family transcriptional regulator, partial [Vicinamibacteria bacterium]|nr:GntR family transcriptional regulator [Vicinamibacteria bacterium]
MDFVLNRKGGVPLHDQLLTQLELKILGGAIAPGDRLPSVRVLARRLGLHANTVSSAYRDLETAGHVELRRGAGVFVRPGAPATLEDARGLDEIVRFAVNAALRKGHSGAEIREAVERWLRAAPAGRVVVVDPQSPTAELVAHEVRSALGVPASGCTLEELGKDPGLVSGALV